MHYFKVLRNYKFKTSIKKREILFQKLEKKFKYIFFNYFDVRVFKMFFHMSEINYLFVLHNLLITSYITH